MTNPKDQIGSKKAPLGVIPATLLPFIAPAMAVGANKYAPFNWRAQPVQGMTYVEAAMRHLLAWIDGQDEAEDTGVHHISHALAGLAILADAIASGNLIDNRPPKGATADLLREQDHSALPGSTLISPFVPVRTLLARNAEGYCTVCGCGPESSHALDCPFW